jgi:hypothetical protein
MPEPGMPPALHGAKGVTKDYINLQICEKLHINPLDWFLVSDSAWKKPKGRALKKLIIGYHQLNAEEEKRVSDEMSSKTKNNSSDKRG